MGEAWLHHCMHVYAFVMTSRQEPNLDASLVLLNISEQYSLKLIKLYSTSSQIEF